MKRNQHERILDWMDHNGSISPMEAFEFLNITKLATRVGELIRTGVRIEKEMVFKKNAATGETVRYMRYRRAA